MTKAFEALAEPTRRRILDLLRDEECSVGQLVAALGMSQPAISKHLKVLRTARLVNVRVDAQRRVYRVQPGPLREIDDWLAPYRSLWATSLDALERHPDRMGDAPRPDGTDENDTDREDFCSARPCGTARAGTPAWTS
jgi:DNA-binding transcriptional ArsR family regulator